MSTRTEKVHAWRAAGMAMALAGLVTVTASAHQGDDHEEPDTGPPLIYGVLDFPNSGTAEAQDVYLHRKLPQDLH